MTKPTGILAGVLAAAAISLAAPAAALEDGRIGVLYVGCIARSAPFWWMRSDPLFSMNFVQATLRDWAGWGPVQQAEEGEAARMVRLYMPRSEKHLASNHDVIILANANVVAVGATYNAMLAAGVSNAEMGLVMFGGWESFGGREFSLPAPPWSETFVGKLLPTEDVVGQYIMFPPFTFRVVIDESEHEFMRSLPWDPRQPFMRNFHHNLVRTKPGAELLAHIEGSVDGDPAMVTWELENGARTFAITGEIIGPSSEPGQLHTMCTRGNPWEYALDFGGNLMIYLDRRPVPQDLELIHLLRSRIFEAGTVKSLLFSLLDFCDSFGANTNSLMLKIDEATAVISEAIPMYLQFRFEEVLEAYDLVHQMLDEIGEEAVRLKERALFWVYVIEWITVTGTGMICGYVIWSLMIRRRLYHEVHATRLRLR